jgi:hypothetical protein
MPGDTTTHGALLACALAGDADRYAALLLAAAHDEAAQGALTGHLAGAAAERCGTLAGVLALEAAVRAGDGDAVLRACRAAACLLRAVGADGLLVFVTASSLVTAALRGRARRRALAGAELIPRRHRSCRMRRSASAMALCARGRKPRRRRRRAAGSAAWRTATRACWRQLAAR